MRLLEAKAAEMAQKERQSTAATSNIMFVRGETTGIAEKNKVINPDEIDIDGSDEDEEETEEVEISVEKQAIPAKVFGGLKKAEEDEEEKDDD